jgi:hypothetical protein
MSTRSRFSGRWLVIASVDSIRLDLPREWQELPTSPSDLRSALADAVARAKWSALDQTERRRAELFLERFVSDVSTSGARLLSVFSERVDDSAQLVAACAVSILDKAALGTNAPLTADVVLAAMSLEPPAEESGARTTNLEPASTIELTVGPAVRVVRLLEQSVSLKEELRVFTETFFIPVPEAFDRLVVAQFSTPNVADAVVFSELFGALANTVRFYREGEPTEL